MTDDDDKVEFLARKLCEMDGAGADAPAIPGGHQIWRAGEVAIIPTNSIRPAWTFYKHKAEMMLSVLDRYEPPKRDPWQNVERDDISSAIKKVDNGYKPEVQTDPDLVVEIVQ